MFNLGVYLDHPFIQVALVQRRGKKIEVRGIKASKISEIGNVKPLYTGFKGRICSGLAAKDFLIRSMEVKVANSRKMDQVIAFQSEATSHFNAADVLTVPLMQKREGSHTEVLLFTCGKNAVKTHLDELAALDIDPDEVGTVPTALCEFIRWKFPDLSNAFIVNLGAEETTCVWMKDGGLKKAHAIPIGIESLLASLFEDRKKILLKKEIEGAAKQIDLLLLKPGLNPRLAAKLNELHLEMGKIYFSFHRGIETLPFLFTGRADAFAHLPEFLMGAAEKSLSLEDQKFAVSIGLALSGPASIQLRREEFFPRKNWKKMGGYGLSLIALSLLFSSALLGMGLYSNSQRKEAMLQRIASNDNEHAEEKIEQWITEIEKNNKEYAYIPQAPKVAEVLSWISSHPLLGELKSEGDPIDLQNLHYELVKFPKIGSSKEPYLAKVEMEFQFKNATNARKFHESLRKGDHRVASNLEITWDALNNSYRTSFFLKNRGPYVR